MAEGTKIWRVPELRNHDWILDFVIAPLLSIWDIWGVAPLAPQVPPCISSQYKQVQQASLILGRFAFYDMIWGYFDQQKVLSKVMLRP